MSCFCKMVSESPWDFIPAIIVVKSCQHVKSLPHRWQEFKLFKYRVPTVEFYPLHYGPFISK